MRLANKLEIPKGMRQSVYEEKKEMALKLLKQGAELEFISKVTFLTIPELQRLNRKVEAVE